MTPDLLLLIAAFVCFVLEAFRAKINATDINLGWVGLALWVLTLLVG